MTKQESIKYISSLINDPAGITEGDQSSIALFRQKYPYFIPARYLLALEDHKKSPWPPPMLSSIQPYAGNWVLLCAFMEAGTGVMQAVSNENSETIANNEQEGLEINARSVPTEGGITEQEVVIVNEEQEVGLKINVAAEPGGEEIGNEEEIIVNEEQEIVRQVNSDPVQTEEVIESQEEEAAVPPAEPVYAFIAAAEDNPYFTEVAGDMPTGAFKDNVAESAFIAEPAPNIEVIFADVPAEEIPKERDEEESLIIPINSQDYFLHQGERVSEDLPEEINNLKYDQVAEDEDKSLMVMMSFSEWLLHFKNVSQKQKEELKDRKALRTMWQKEKLAAAMEEENEEIPENVFEMAVNSISNEDGLVSETLADIYAKQGKYDKAIDVYRKLSLRNPQKNVYFARKIDEILKDKQS